jgi:predicted nucleic acid-binding protein
MAVYLLDTNIIIDALNGKRGRKALLYNLVQQGHMLACCPISVAEIYAGMRPKEEVETEVLLSSLRFYPISWQSAKAAGLLKRHYARAGRTLSIADTLIAAVALENRLTLITDNVKDFPMRELSIYSPPGS